jgi:hypothetical protein
MNLLEEFEGEKKTKKTKKTQISVSWWVSTDLVGVGW